VSDPDDGRRPFRFSLLELIVFLLLVTAVQGAITLLIEWGGSAKADEIARELGRMYGGPGPVGSVTRSPVVQAPLFLVSITVALLGSAWGSWTAGRLKVTSSAPRAGLMALGALWVAMLPVAATSLLTLPFVIQDNALGAVVVLLFSWAVVVGANTLPVHLYRTMRRDERERREDERLGPLPPAAPAAPAAKAAPEAPETGNALERAPGGEGGGGGEVTVEGEKAGPADDD